MDQYPTLVGGGEYRVVPHHWEHFVHEENLRRLRRQLAVETDPTRIKVLQALLTEELSRDAAVSDHAADPPHPAPPDKG